MVEDCVSFSRFEVIRELWAESCQSESAAISLQFDLGFAG